MDHRASGDVAQRKPFASPPPARRGIKGEVFTRGPGMTIKARHLRSNPTEAERALWRVLRRDALGLRFRRQMPVLQRYILDFYAPSIRLSVEVDGGQHAGNAQDQQRTDVLNAHGISVLRFWNSEVLQALPAVTASIQDVVDFLQSGAPPSKNTAPLTTTSPSTNTSPLAPLRDGGGERVAHLNFSMGHFR